MSKMNQVPPMVADMIQKVVNKAAPVWQRDNNATTLEAIVEEGQKALKQFYKERERALKEAR